MATEWRSHRLGDICSLRYGKFIAKKDLDGGPYPTFSGYAVVGHHSEFLYEEPQLVVVCRGVGGSGDIKMSPPKSWITNLSIVVSPNDDRVVHKRFLYWALIASDRSPWITGSAQHQVTIAHLGTHVVRLPDIAEQRAIAEILDSLDDKIELNRRMSETLETMTRAIFRSWFVDFDPVRAKAEGRASGLPKRLADVFPARLVDSAVGEIPEAWSLLPLYEVAEFINGAAYGAFQPNNDRRGLPIVKIAELKTGVTTHTKFSDVAMPDRYRIGRGEILFSWSGNPDTSIDTFVWPHDQAWLNQHIFRVLVREPQERPFVLALLGHLRPVFAEIARNKQTTGLGHVTVADMKRLLVVRPDREGMKACNKMIGPLLDRAFLNEIENQWLTKLRDGLLPKLTSGELRVALAA